MIDTKAQSLESGLAQLSMRTAYMTLSTTPSGSSSLTSVAVEGELSGFKIKTYQDGITQARKVLCHGRKKVAAFFSTEPTKIKKEMQIK